MKIGLCLRTWGEQGGIGVYTRNLVKTMLSFVSKHQFYLFYSEKSHVGQFNHLGHVKEAYVPAPEKFLWDQVAIPYYAGREGLDILFHPKFTIPLLSKCKTVTVVHGSERFVYPEFSHKGDMLYFKTLYPLYLRRATAIISVSENARGDIIRFLNINPEKVKTIHLAQSGRFRQITDRALLETIRRKYNLPEKFILNVGLIYPGKNIPNLLRAFKRVREKEEIKLVLVGRGRRMYRDALKLINELGLEKDVLMSGYISHDDLVAVYNLAQLVVIPSFYESFCLPVLEAMACGTPVVASGTGGVPEVSGNAALYANPKDDYSIADAILRVITDQALRHDLVEKGFRNVGRFSWEKTARLTVEFLESLV